MEKKSLRVIAVATLCAILFLSMAAYILYFFGGTYILHDIIASFTLQTDEKPTKTFRIPTSAMKPTLQPGDKILTVRYLTAEPDPKRWEVIVFKSPVEKSRYLVKRVVGLPGEVLEIKNYEVFINDKLMPYKFRYSNKGDFGKDGAKITIPRDRYYVLGDNSANSVDSRYFGLVPRKDIVGKVVRVIWPINRVGDIEYP